MTRLPLHACAVYANRSELETRRGQPIYYCGVCGHWMVERWVTIGRGGGGAIRDVPTLVSCEDEE